MWLHEVIVTIQMLNYLLLYMCMYSNTYMYMYATHAGFIFIILTTENQKAREKIKSSS